MDKVEGKEGKAEAEKRVYEAKLDLNYIMHYPPGEKYISLFKDAGVMRERRDRVRREVERRMKRGGLGESTMDFNDQEEGGAELGSGGEGWKAEERDRRVKKDKKGKSKKIPAEERKLEEQDDFFEF